MRIKTIVTIVAASLLVTALSVRAENYGEEDSIDTSVRLKKHTLFGPRLGMSYIATKNETYQAALDEHSIGNTISQFGWQFEWLVRPEGGGPAFVTELIPFLGGFEYSTIIPSVSLLFGIRMPMGFEFGMGPQVAVTFTEHQPVNPSLVIAIGQSLSFSGVNIPLNLALSTSKSGNTVSFVFGYALEKS